MKVIGCFALLGLFGAQAEIPGTTDDATAQLKLLVKKIVTAHGDAKRLEAVRAFLEKTKSTAPSGSITTLDRYIQLPNQSRQESEFDLGDKGVKCVLVFAGDNGWRKMEGDVAQPYRAASKGKKAPLKYAGPRAWLRLLDPAYKLTSLGETKVNDRPAFGIQLSVGTDPPEKLFFDKVTGLLLKEEKTLRYTDGRLELHETFYADYQPDKGIPIAHKITKTLDGKTIQQIEVTEFKIVDKLDAKLFEKP